MEKFYMLAGYTNANYRFLEIVCNLNEVGKLWERLLIW